MTCMLMTASSVCHQIGCPKLGSHLKTWSRLSTAGDSRLNTQSWHRHQMHRPPLLRQLHPMLQPQMHTQACRPPTQLRCLIMDAQYEAMFFLSRLEMHRNAKSLYLDEIGFPKLLSHRRLPLRARRSLLNRPSLSSMSQPLKRRTIPLARLFFLLDFRYHRTEFRATGQRVYSPPFRLKSGVVSRVRGEALLLLGCHHSQIWAWERTPYLVKLPGSPQRRQLQLLPPVYERARHQLSASAH
jgi:hypothetical protein